MIHIRLIQVQTETGILIFVMREKKNQLQNQKIIQNQKKNQLQKKN